MKGTERLPKKNPKRSIKVGEFPKREMTTVGILGGKDGNLGVTKKSRKTPGLPKFCQPWGFDRS